MAAGRGRSVTIIVVIVALLIGAMIVAGVCLHVLSAMGGPKAAKAVRADKRVQAAEAKIQAELDRIRDAGEPVTADDIVPPPVPDAQNAALLYQKAFDALRLEEAEHSPLVLVRRSPVSQRETLIPEVRAIVAKNAQAITLTYEATRRPACRFPVNWEDGAAAFFPHLYAMKKLSWLVAAQGVLHASDGNVHGALQASRVGITLGDHLTDEPSTLSQAARYGLCWSALDGLYVTLSSHAVPADLGKPIYDQLAAIEIMGPFKRALLRERAGFVTIYQMAQSDPKLLGIDLNRVQKAILPPLWTINAAEWLPLMGERLALADQPYRAARSTLTTLDAKARELQEAHSDDPVVEIAIGAGLGDPVSRLWRERDIAIARIGLARAALVLEAYQAKKGAYPASLDALRRAVAWEIPQDPFSGQDFVYKRQGSAAVFYSIGPDLRDHGGAPLKREREQRLGDITWRLAG